jgi:predicted MPP superfamily phosphohydrolase
MEINIDKSGGELEELNIVAASDIHLGTIIRNSRLKYIVDKINNLSPDLILLPGDIVDEDVSSVMEQNMASILKQLNAKYGVYAITGNHEYIGGVQETVKYIRDGNVTVLMDSIEKIANSFYLIGRKDHSAISFGDSRDTLATILESADKSLPLILVDHQPFNLEEAQMNGIDFQISGHTHHGQLFPFNFITKRVYEKSWGYMRKNSTQYYVSCGVGTWGPPMRLGNRPEILNIKVLFR